MAMWFALILLLLWPTVQMALGHRTLIPADNLFQFAPYKAAAYDLGVSKAHTPLYSDLILQNYAWWQFILKSLEEGQLPLWNPYIFSGTPFLAKGQHMALYPLSLPFYLVPLAQAFGLFIVIHLCLAAASAFFFARTIGISRFGALISGLIFGLSGVLLARVVFPMVIAAAVWLPFVLAMAERIITRYPFHQKPQLLFWILLGGLALGFQALVGHPEVFIYTLLTLLFYSLWRCISLQKRPDGSLLPIALSLVLMVILGLFIGVVQLLPQFLVLQENFRKEAADLSQILSWSYPWQQAITALVPNYFGNPALYSYSNIFTGITETLTSPLSWGTKNFVEGAMYVGILPLLLAFCGLWRQQHHEKQSLSMFPSPFLFGALVVLSLCFVFGTPLYALIFFLPGMEQIHSPFRWVLVMTFGLSILSGYGLDRLQLRPSQATIIARGSILLGCVILGGLVLVRLFFEQAQPLVKAIFNISTDSGTAFSDMQAFFSYELPWVIQLVCMLIFSGVALYTLNRAVKDGDSIYAQIWKPLVALIITVDLLLFANQLYPRVDPMLLQHTPAIISRMQQDQSDWRFSTFDPEGKKIFPANAGWLHNIKDIRGYDSIFSDHYRSYMETIGTQDQLQYNRISPLRSLAALNSPLLDLLNVKYILSQTVVQNPKYVLVAKEEEVLLYQNTEVMPRTFTLPVSATIFDENPFAVMRQYDPRFHMILPESDSTSIGEVNETLSSPQSGQRGEARITRYRNNEIVISVTAEQPLWLVLADSYDKGWQALAWPTDNPDQLYRLPVERAYGALRTVKLQPGDWMVRFRYRPLSLMVGLCLSLFAGGGTFMGLLVVYCKTGKSDS